jgi:competence protein ComEC
MASTDVNILNVGAGSCALVESPSGRYSMIDINDGTDLREAAAMTALDRLVQGAAIKSISAKLEDPIAFCHENGINELWRFVLSHPDADHMAGIRRILAGELPALNFWNIPHNRRRTSRDDFQTDAAYQDWLAYQALRDGTLSSSPRLLNPLRGAANHYWVDDDIEILSPTHELVTDCDQVDKYNNASYVLRINHRPSSVLLPGDVEDKAWNDMVDAGVDLTADVLVASHHGRRSGYSESAMEAINPTVVILSTDKLDPAHDAEAEYREWTRYVYSTREWGTLWVRMYDTGAFDVFCHDGKIDGFVRHNAA